MSQPRQFVIRFTLRQLLAFLAVTLYAAGIFTAIYLATWVLGLRTEIITMAESNSPDGLHRVVVTEVLTSGQATTHVQLFRLSGMAWTIQSDDRISNDSVSRSNYSIVWTLDPHHAPTSVTVFGDFGSPPFPGNPMFTVSFP